MFELYKFESKADVKCLPCCHCFSYSLVTTVLDLVLDHDQDTLVWEMAMSQLENILAVYFYTLLSI